MGTSKVRCAPKKGMFVSYLANNNLPLLRPCSSPAVLDCLRTSNHQQRQHQRLIVGENNVEAEYNTNTCTAGLWGVCMIPTWLGGSLPCLWQHVHPPHWLCLPAEPPNLTLPSMTAMYTVELSDGRAVPTWLWRVQPCLYGSMFNHGLGCLTGGWPASALLASCSCYHHSQHTSVGCFCCWK